MSEGQRCIHREHLRLALRNRDTTRRGSGGIERRNNRVDPFHELFDIDLFVDRKDLTRAAAVFSNMGYIQGILDTKRGTVVPGIAVSSVTILSPAETPGPSPDGPGVGVSSEDQSSAGR